MNILGVSCYYHDAAAALLQDGLLVAAAEEERFSRKKHDYGFPKKAIDFCLRHAGLAGPDLDFVVFYEKPLVKFERVLLTTLATYPRSWEVFREAAIGWLSEKLWIKDRLRGYLGLPAEKVLFVDHHTAHAASTFFCSPFKKAAVLTIDGVGEWQTATLGTATADWDGTGQNSIRLTYEMRFPHSVGLLYSTFTAFLGFEVNDGEYKVMGMAAYGQPRYQEKVYRLLQMAPDGSIWLDMNYFSYHYSTHQAFNRRFEDLFGKPRDPESPFLAHLPPEETRCRTAEVEASRYYADVAASIQRVTEDIILKMANYLHRETGLSALCLAGGVALNSLANGRLLRETPFEDIFIQPAPGDSGGAVGAALFAWHVLLGKPRKFVMEHAYLGQGFEEPEIREFLDGSGIRYEVWEEDALLDRLVGELERGKVIGWFQGRFEWGPRALGNRSILADPRRLEMKDLVNRMVKFREPFRPFAPVILEERACDFFEALRDPRRIYPARYMLLVLPWKGNAGGRIPAVNHVGTGRLQTLRREWNPRYYRLVEKFGEATGVPVLLNTSFNLRGEPMVGSPADAWNTFRRSGLDMLVMGNYVVTK